MTKQSTSGTAQAKYQKYQTDREVFLQRARDCAKLTIPTLMTEDGSTSGKEFPTPFQSVGARGVNNLAAKLLMSLLPPNQPFFRLRVEDLVLEEQQDEEWRTEIEKALSKIERTVAQHIETQPDRVVLYEALRHILVTGNCLLFCSSEGMRLFHLDKYVAKRDAEGNILEMITVERLSPQALPEKLFKKLKRVKKLQEDEDGAGYKSVELYTHVERHNDKWTIYQECQGEVVPDSRGTYPLDSCPWIVLRMNRIDGEDYGRSYVEDFLGDLRSLEALSQAIVEGAAASARVLLLVNPNGTTRVKAIAEAPNGAVREGNAEDVTVLQLQKAADFSVALQKSNEIEERLSFAFLLHSAIQRNAERVTAEEIRYMAQELETALGGVYSILTQEFQMPYVKTKMWRMEKEGMLPALPKDTVSPSIVTGMEALGRGQDRNKLVAFIRAITETVGPQALGQFCNIQNLLERLATAEGIDTEGLFKSKEQLAQEKQQAQMQQMTQQLGPDAIKQIGGMIQQGQQHAHEQKQAQMQPGQSEEQQQEPPE